jgi:cytochrome c553
MRLLAAVLLTCAAAPLWAAQTQAAFKPDAAKGQALATTCLACHTADGTRGAPANPILQGQHAEYLLKQLREFKSGKRKNAIMSGMVATLSDEDMQHLSAFYAAAKGKPGFAKNKATLALGEKIYRGGVAERQVPACSGCHSPTGAGIPAQYPRLSGQHGDYTEAQLVAFRSGARGNNAQMSTIAGKMNDLEIKAVSDYIAGLR